MLHCTLYSKLWRGGGGGEGTVRLTTETENTNRNFGQLVKHAKAYPGVEREITALEQKKKKQIREKKKNGVVEVGGGEGGGGGRSRNENTFKRRLMRVSATAELSTNPSVVGGHVVQAGCQTNAEKKQ